jgi:hypothetical protein
MALSLRKIEAVLQRKFGFMAAEKAPDHRRYELRLDGLPVITTKFSHTKKKTTAGKVLESEIAKQLKVRTGFLREMISCAKSQEEYYAQVRNDPFPPWPNRLLRRG